MHGLKWEDLSHECPGCKEAVERNHVKDFVKLSNGSVQVWHNTCRADAQAKERDERAARIEASLRELLDAFNPEPRVSTRLTIWGRAAMALDGTPDQDATA